MLSRPENGWATVEIGGQLLDVSCHIGVGEGIGGFAAFQRQGLCGEEMLF